MEQPLAEDDDEPNPGSVSKEKREVLRNDRQVRTTYFQHAQTDPDLELGGRFKKLTPTDVVGARAGPVYPQLPSTAPVNQAAMVPDEPPLGYCVDEIEPVGERHELIASSPVAGAQAIESVPSTAQAVEPTVAPASVVAGHASFRLKRRRI